MLFVKKLFIFLGFFIIFFFIGFYGYHLYKYPSDAELSEQIKHLRKHYPDELIMKVGSKLIEPQSRINHFLNFPLKKEKGTIRIGAFGDSYTYGDEVNKEANYPFQLQNLLNHNFPLLKIEVLNFGSRGQSFQEQFFLWEKYANLYEVDYILYGPRGFYANRDLTFQKNWIFADFHFPKDRFILSKEGKVSLVELKGSSPEKKYKNYYSFFPSFTALRYDKKPFQLLEKHFPFLRKQLRNPFYYSNLEEHIESQRINQTLLNKIRATYNKKILILTIRKPFLKGYQSIKDLYNLNFFNSFDYKFPYKVFGHLSSLGNEIAAHVYFNSLIGNKKFKLNIMNCNFKKEKSIISIKKNITFYKINKIFIGTKNILLGEIRSNASDHYWRERGASFFQNKPQNIKNFIGFSGISSNSFGLSLYFSVPIKLNSKSIISIKFFNEERIILGQIRILDSFGKFFNFYMNYSKIKIDNSESYFEVHFIKKNLPSKLKDNFLLYPNKKISVLIDDYILGELISSTYKGEPSFVLKPRSRNSFLMMGPQHLVQERQLPPQFPLYMHYRMKDGRTLKSLIPEWNCRKEKHTYQLDLPNFEPLKKLHTSTASHPF